MAFSIAQSARRTVAPRGGLKVLAVAKPVKAAVSVKANDDAQMQVFKMAALGVVAGNMMMAGQAEAAQQIATLADTDNRILVLAALFLPVLGWVGFNMLGPVLNQVETMADKAKKRAVIAGAGLGLASLLAAGDADAAQQIATLADTDNRILVLAALFLPVLGWVGFNMLGPVLNQVETMADKAKKRAVVAGAGLGLSSLLVAGNADAAQQIATLADTDNRILVLAALFLPVLGWVGFNMLGPVLNQVETMADKAKKRAVVAGAGLGLSSLLVAGNADAAQQIATLADTDSRILVLAALFLPVLGWVGFNMLGPVLNQVETMADKAKKRAVVAGAGLGLSSLLVAGNADAAQQIATLADSDNRVLVLAALFLPVVGWVGFNILGPVLNQVETMADKQKKK